MPVATGVIAVAALACADPRRATRAPAPLVDPDHSRRETTRHALGDSSVQSGMMAESIAQPFESVSAYVAPVSWLVAHNVHETHEHMNYST